MNEPVLVLRKQVDRLYALDLLRGVCALGVAVYHITLWSHVNLHPVVKSLLSLFGTYGVSVFFVLSGYTLAHVYDERFNESIDPVSLNIFFKRRIARIAPLYFLVIVVSILGKAILGDLSINPFTFIANATLIFGFAYPSESPVIGGWSIGIEVVFYVLLPLLMMLRRQAALVLLSAAILTLYVSSNLTQFSTLSQGWSEYVNPANQWIFFSCGVYACFYMKRSSIRASISIPAIIFILLISAAVCVNGSELDLVTGWRRLFFVPASVVLVAIVGKLLISSIAMQKICSALGALSYPVYLIHPLVFFSLGSLFHEPYLLGSFCLVVISLAISFAVNKYVDLPIQRHLKAWGW